jgi:DNA-binding LacI/PurR family transcriptional regulator
VHREVTIRDVANAAKVSPSTVSNLLNGRDGRMRKRTRQRVERAIDELGYRPSRVARQLRTGRAQLVGLVVPSVANPFWGGFARVLEAEALSHGLQVLLCNSERDPERERSYVDELWAGGVRSVVLGTSLPSLDHLQDVMSKGLSLVAFDRERQPRDPEGLHSISVDNLEGGRIATQHLIDLGHERIGFISGAIATVSRKRRLAGYQQALEQAGIAYSPSLVWADESAGFGDVVSAQLGHDGMAALLRKKRPPTAVVAINDMYAMGACSALRDAGKPAPAVSVVGFDDLVLAPLFNPPLTTIRQPLEEMARFAMDVIRGATTEPPPQTILAPKLIVRGSTATLET